MNLNQKFLLEIGNCKDPVVFIGLAKTLNVSLFNEETNDPMDFADMLAGTMERYNKLNRARKKELLKVLKDANRTKIKENKNNKSE